MNHELSKHKHWDKGGVRTMQHKQREFKNTCANSLNIDWFKTIANPQESKTSLLPFHIAK